MTKFPLEEPRGISSGGIFSATEGWDALDDWYVTVLLKVHQPEKEN